MWNKQLYQETFSKVCPSRECCQEVLNMVNSVKPNPVKKHHPIGRNLLIAAALAAAMILSVSGYAVFQRYRNPKPMLEAAFGENGYTAPSAPAETVSDTQLPPVDFQRVPLNPELADTMVAPYLCGVEQTITAGDLSLTVEAYCYDELTHAGLVYYRLHSTKGLAYDLQPDGEVWHRTGELLTMGHVNHRSYLVPDQADGQGYTAIAYFYQPWYPEDAPDSVQNEPLIISLRSGDNAAGTSEAITLPLRGFGGSLEPMPHVELEDGKILLTPISIRMSQRLVEELNQSSFHQRDHLKIVYKDGSEYVVRDADTASFALWTGDAQGCGTTSFTRIVDLPHVKSIVVGTAELPVSGSTVSGEKG